MPNKSFWKWIIGIAASLLLIFSIGLGILWYKARGAENQMRQWVESTLSQRFQSKVELAGLHVEVFPKITVVGTGLQLRHHNRTDIPPLIQIEKFSFQVGIAGLLRPTKHIDLVRLQHLVITMPPRGPKTAKPPKAPDDEQKKENVPDVVIDKIICDDTDLFTTPTQPGKEPLDWDIHNLVLDSVSLYKPFSFHGVLTNAKPVGEIDTTGQFGPWDADEPGDSPVSGEYKFTNADLGPFPGIDGTLSSTGKYGGPLNNLETSGVTDVPDFSLDKVGKPVSLHTEFSATVDGTNGDTLLHPVRATLVQTLILTEGKVVRSQDPKGHIITMDTSVPNGRIQDILALAMTSEKPLMTGPVKIKAKLMIPPGKEKVLDKMTLDGVFGVDDAKWSSPELREKLQSLSRHAQGKPEDEDAGSSVSDLKGNFRLENGVITFRSLTFSVEGAAIDLAGTYAIRGGELDLNGHLRLKAKLSQTMTGAKSFFLKAFDPFFAKNGAGTELPISITGTRDKPVFGVSVFHKTIKKDMATGGNDKKDDKKSDNKNEKKEDKKDKPKN